MPAPLPQAQRKRSTNLSLAPERLRFGQRYAEIRDTSLSQVVEDLLAALEQSLQADADQRDPLDGLLAGWPEEDKKSLRRAQHSNRAGR